jgi:uncharacterized protein (TIGR00730 family)
MQRQGSVCVYAGSSFGADPAFGAAARELGRVIAERGCRLVYGGSHVGLMGVVADTVLRAGGAVVGVIPDVLAAEEIAHPALTELRVVGSMHERKLTMMDLADGFVALPGGTGTLEELFETFTWLQLGLHAKPIGLLDVHGYWGRLTALLDHAVESQLLRREHADMLLVDVDPAALLDRFAVWSPPDLPKWIDRRSA